MMNDLPKRKPLRLPHYDYSQRGAYFITICTIGRQPILGTCIPPAVCHGICRMAPTPVGAIVEECWGQLAEHLPGVRADTFVMMPDHIHGILFLEGGPGEEGPGGQEMVGEGPGGQRPGGQGRPPLQKVIQGFKSITTRRCFSLGYRRIWQRSFYDHVIRTEADYLRIRQYILDNPAHLFETFPP